MPIDPNQADPDERLLRAAAANHRRWFERAEAGNRLVDPGADAGELIEEARRAAPARLGVWSMAPDDLLGARLVARGFEWGWQPHWMGARIEGEPDPPEEFAIVPAAPPLAKTLPYRDAVPPTEAAHLGVRLREKLVGQVAVLPGEDGVAGIYAMGVVPKVRRRGIGMALMRAALQAAWERGCDAAVLNATPDGERLYSRVGFWSLGMGQTWWSKPGSEPTERQAAISEAVGLGDLAALDALAPTESEVADAVPLGVMTGQTDTIDHLLRRFPALVGHRFPPDGGNLLHLAVEYDRPEIVEVARRHGVDPDARDATYGATPADWAEHLGRQALSASRTTSGPGNSPGLGDS